MNEDIFRLVWSGCLFLAFFFGMLFVIVVPIMNEGKVKKRKVNTINVVSMGLSDLSLIFFVGLMFVIGGILISILINS